MKTKGLGPLLTGHKALSLAGMCKNAGKTTVLNQVLKELAQEKQLVGLTSIGRDGEARDLVTGTYKPRIYVTEGTIFATAAGLLSNCDTTHEILETTGIHTPLGEVIVLASHSDGFVDLAGPSMNQQLVELSEIFARYQVDKVLIDGAISRKSLCSRRVADGVILCTGASYHADMNRVIQDTAYISGLLQLKEKAGLSEEVFSKLKQWRENKNPLEKYSFLMEQEAWKAAAPGQTLVDAMREKEHAGASLIWLEGAVTDALLKPLLMSNLTLKGSTFLVEDASKLLLSRDIYEKLLWKGAEICVLEEISLVAVTINPFSAYGNHFDKTAFIQRMQEAVNLPVLNVMEDMP